MARREKDVDMPRRGNFKGGMDQTSARGGAKPKKTRGVATTEAVKKMKQKESSMAKPKPKPSKPAKPAAAKSGATYGDPKSKVKANGATTRSLSAKSEVKAPTRSLSPRPVKLLGFPLGTSSLKEHPMTRHTLSRSASHINASRGANSKKAQEYRKTQKPKPQRSRALSDNSVTRKRKPLATGARSANQSGTGYKEGSIMDTITRIRRGIYKPKRAAPPKAMSSKDRRKARTGR